MTIYIRHEQPSDHSRIPGLVERAFLHAPHAAHTEQFITGALRKAGALTISLVAFRNEEMVGHAAASPVLVNGREAGWYGIGPVAVLPACHNQGIGSAMMRRLLDGLRAMNARGCVLVGDAAYYGRFGFHSTDKLAYPPVPREFFHILGFTPDIPEGEVSFHSGFEATE